MLFAACDSSTGSNGTDCDENPALPELAGSLYYGSGPDTFYRYDLAAQTETSVYHISETGAFDFTVSPGGKYFAWADDSEATDQGSPVQIHDMDDPVSFEEVFLESANIQYTETSLALAPDGEMIGALVLAEESNRDDLVFFESDGTFFRGYPLVKAFAFGPNGDDLVVSMEVRPDDGPAGYVVGVIRNYRDETPEAYIVREFADYNQLPTNLAVSPNSTTVAYAFNGHIYTLPLQEGADHHQITTSGSREWNVRWSPDGDHLVMTFLASGISDQTGTVVIVPVHQNEEPVRISTDINHDVQPDEAYAPFPIQFEDGDGHRVNANDPGAFWIP